MITYTILLIWKKKKTYKILNNIGKFFLFLPSDKQLDLFISFLIMSVVAVSYLTCPGPKVGKSIPCARLLIISQMLIPAISIGWGAVCICGRVAWCWWSVLHRNSCGCISCWQRHLSRQKVSDCPLSNKCWIQ